MNTFLGVTVIAALAFAAGWVMHERFNDSEPPEPKNNLEDNTHNPFVN